MTTVDNKKNTKKYKYIVGIDLGTTNSCLSVVKQKDKGPEVIANSTGDRTTPSIVYFGEDGTTQVGKMAHSKLLSEPQRTFFSVKRLIGANEVPEGCKNLPYKVSKYNNRIIIKTPEDKVLQPEQVSAEVLKYLATAAIDYLGVKADEVGVVVTVPAYFNNEQREATKTAAAIAGLNVVRMINQPTAAALDFGYAIDNDTIKDGKTIVVFDLGGGTFDISILEYNDGHLEVKSTNGHSYLGGDDWTKAIVDYVLREFKKKHGIDLAKDITALGRIQEECEKTKKTLSSEQSVKLNIPYIAVDASGHKHLDIEITRATFNRITEYLVSQLEEPCRIAMADANLTNKDIDDVLLVGGSTRIPIVQEAIERIFEKKPSKSVNPDEAVARGAAIQGAVLTGSIKDILLLDVTPLTLGIETMGGVLTSMIEKNTTIPAKKSQIFSTAADNQPSVTIAVYQGERSMAADNKKIGEFNLTGIAPAPRGVPQIEVSFDIDASGVLSVSAIDKKTNKEQKITIENSGGLSQEEVERMKKEAEENKEKDQQKRQLVDAKVAGEVAIMSSSKVRRERKDDVDANLLSELEEKEKAVQEAINKEDKAAITEATNELTSKVYAIPPKKEEATNEEVKNPEEATAETTNEEATTETEK